MSMKSTNDRMQEAVSDNDDTGYLIGTVIANIDPLGIGRIQCSIPNLFDPTQGPVPWIGPHKKSPFGQGPGWGVYGSPAINSLVRVKLQNNDPSYGIFEADEYPVGSANSKFASPQTWGFKDPSGNELFINMASGDWQFTHQSGITIFFDTGGNRTTHIPGNDVLTVVGNSQQTISGALTINVSGNVSLTAGGTVDITGSTINLN